MASLAFPLINGVYYDFSSVELVVNGVRFGGIKSFNYKHSLKPGIVRGTRAQKVGRTRGEYEASGSIEIYKADWDLFLTTLIGTTGTLGFMEASFDVVAAYVEPSAAGVKVDVVRGCRITDAETSPAEGSDPIVVKCELDAMYILENGKSPLTTLLK